MRAIKRGGELRCLPVFGDQMKVRGGRKSGGGRADTASDWSSGDSRIDAAAKNRLALIGLSDAAFTKQQPHPMVWQWQLVEHRV